MVIDEWSILVENNKIYSINCFFGEGVYASLDEELNY